LQLLQSVVEVACPSVAIRLHEHIHVDTLEESLRRGDGDIGISPRLRQWSGPRVALGWEEFFLTLPSSDELAARESVPVTALAGREWVLFEAENGLSDLIEAVCRDAGGFQPRGTVRTSQVSAAANVAAAGLGVTMIPGSNIPVGLDAAVLPIDPPVVRELAAYARTSWSPTGLAYLNLLDELAWQRDPPDGAIAYRAAGRGA
jgi:DNA-binding transcriptional LysR family regulator